MPSFTKGKWEAANFGGYILTNDNEMVVAQVHGWEYLKNKGLSDKEVIDVQNANARLIAAAPEMHHLLRCFIAIDDLKSESFTDDNHPLYMRALVEQDAAVKATRALLDCIDGKEEQE